MTINGSCRWWLWSARCWASTIPVWSNRIWGLLVPIRVQPYGVKRISSIGHHKAHREKVHDQIGSTEVNSQWANSPSHDAWQKRASTRPGTRWARESDGTLWTGESFCHCCPVLPSSRLKEGPPLVVPIEMWVTLPKGECIGSWENQLSMEGRVPQGRNHSTDKAITYPIGVGRGQDLYGVNPRARWRISFIWNSGSEVVVYARPP